uniref:Cytochrome b5 heme-binding domain-containing protein n=1 Tax=Anopheles farauti TaxID=69004 RepID=A0A182R175_9DIPT
MCHGKDVGGESRRLRSHINETSEPGQAAGQLFTSLDSPPSRGSSYTYCLDLSDPRSASVFFHHLQHPSSVNARPRVCAVYSFVRESLSPFECIFRTPTPTLGVKLEQIARSGLQHTSTTSGTMSGPETVASTAPSMDDQPADGSSGSLLYDIVYDIVSSPVNLALVGVISFLLYKISKSRQQPATLPPPPPELPRLRRDFTVAELKKYDGTQPDGRVLTAINGNVFDVTKGKAFYGPGGNYAVFGGRDASRGLATFQITSSISDEYDDLSDLNSHEMESMREWEMQFKEKYYVVGRLLKPGEKPTNYSDEDEDTTPAEGASNVVRKRTTPAATEEPASSGSTAASQAPAPSTESATPATSQDAPEEADKPKAE